MTTELFCTTYISQDFAPVLIRPDMRLSFCPGIYECPECNDFVSWGDMVVEEELEKWPLIIYQSFYHKKCFEEKKRQ